MVKILMFCFLLGLGCCTFIGCSESPPQPKKVVQVLTKKVFAKEKEIYNKDELDSWALLDGKFRTRPKTNTRFMLFAEDGTYLIVSAKVYAMTQIGHEISASETEWKK